MININSINMIKYIIIVILTSLLGNGCMSKSELSQQEKEQLKDMDSFNSSIKQKGWHLKNKRLEDEILRGIRLNNSSFVDVEFRQIDMSRCEIQNSTFDRVIFAGTDVTVSKIKDTEFKSCNFTNTKFVQTEFTKCVFNSCRGLEVRMGKSSFRDCEFHDLTDNLGNFDSAVFHNCNIEKSMLQNTSLYNAELDSTKFSDVVLDNAAFSGAKFKNTGFYNTSIDFCDFAESTIDVLAFEHCKSKGMSLIGAHIIDLEFNECSDFDRMSVIESEGRDISIKNCKDFLEPMFSLSKIENLVIVGSTLEYLDCNESVFTGDNRIGSSTIKGINFVDAQVKGMTFDDCTITTYIILNKARFDGLTLNNIQYSEDIKIKAKDAEYVNSDKFPSE